MNRRPERTPSRIARITGMLVVVQVIFGTAVTSGALMRGNLLVAALGLLIISGAATSAVLLVWVRRVDDSVDGITDGLNERYDRKQRFEGSGEQSTVAENGVLEQERPVVVNLARFGPGDPSPITAATLDRSTFPRLVRTMDDHPPARAADGMESGCLGSRRETFVSAASDGGDSSSPAIRMAAPPSDARDAATGEVAVHNLLRTWTLALRDLDLAACRGVYATLVHLVDLTRAMTLTSELERLIEQTEQSLRREFSACVQRRDYTRALVIGERIRTLLFDRPVARAFERIEPLLQRAMMVGIAHPTGLEPPIRAPNASAGCPRGAVAEPVACAPGSVDESTDNPDAVSTGVTARRGLAGFTTSA